VPQDPAVQAGRLPATAELRYGIDFMPSALLHAGIVAIVFSHNNA
jgi:hypothetical protein